MKSPKPKRVDLSLLTTLSFWLTLGLSLLVAGGYVFSRPEIHLLPELGLLEIIEAQTLDLRFLLRGNVRPRDDIVIVAVDEKSEDELGRWQSAGRQWLAKLLHILREGHAKVIGFDLVLAEPDEGVGLKLVDDLKAQYQEHLSAAVTSYPALLTYLEDARTAQDYDRQLADAIQQAGNVVLGVYHFWDAASAAHLTPERHNVDRRLLNRVKYENIQTPPGTAGQRLRLPHSLGVEPNLPAFSAVAKSFGHFNVVTDRDGAIRFAYLLMESQGAYYPSLDVEVARTYLNPPAPPFVNALGPAGAGQELLVDTIELGHIAIPCDEKGKLFINYYGPAQTFPHYAIADVLRGRIPPYKFADKIVLVGVTSRIYQDLYATPFQDALFPGVEIHATVIENIIQHDFLTRPEWTTLVTAALIFALGLLLGVVRHQKSPLWGVWAALLSLLGVAGMAYAAFRFGKIWLNVTYPGLFIVIDYLTITSYKYFTEEKQKRLIKNAFQHYLSPNVIHNLLKRVGDLKLGGERKQLTALFADIRGFTSISERLSPEQLVQFLNEYLSEMSQIVLTYEGTIDKYMGDAIMAFYGAPISQADHAARACRTAVDMLVRLKELRIGWEARGLPPMDIGIGVNSGDMSVGNMGSRERFDYTIMGDHVNLASRLEGINKEYGTNIVISQFTYALLPPEAFTVRELDTVKVKGKNEPVTIYELVGYGALYEQRKPLIAKFCEGLAAYKQRQWTQASTCFQEALQLAPQDKPSQMYLARCSAYLQTPPPDDWDGVFVMKTK